MPRHFLDLEGAALIQTEPFLLVETAVDDCVARRAIMAVVGDAGLGKSFATENAYERHDELARAWVKCRHKPRTKPMVLSLFKAVTGVEEEGSVHQLVEDLRQVLSEQPRLVVIDEAQELNLECVELLRWLHDHPDTQFALALVGGHGCWKVLSSFPMLHSRIYRKVAFRPLTPKEVLTVIPRYHPIYRKAERELIAEVDDRFAHGTLRRWASFTASAHDLCQQHGLTALTEPVMRAAFTKLGGVG